MARVIVGCKLPNGIILENPANPDDKVELNGKNKAIIAGADYATTEVDADFFSVWLENHQEFPAVVSGAIFFAKNSNDAAAIAKEMKDEKTGLEPMQTDGKDPRAAGVVQAEQ